MAEISCCTELTVKGKTFYSTEVLKQTHWSRWKNSFPLFSVCSVTVMHIIRLDGVRKRLWLRFMPCGTDSSGDEWLRVCIINIPIILPSLVLECVQYRRGMTNPIWHTHLHTSICLSWCSHAIVLIFSSHPHDGRLGIFFVVGHVLLLHINTVHISQLTLSM